MLGYDTLLGSHYDKYEVLYTYFDIGVPTEEIFKIPEGNVIHALYCRGGHGSRVKVELRGRVYARTHVFHHPYCGLRIEKKLHVDHAVFPFQVWIVTGSQDQELSRQF